MGRLNNIVVIGKGENIERYIYAIILRMNPEVYNQEEHKCIILQVNNKLKDVADFIIKKMKHAGLNIDSESKRSVQTAGYTLDDIWEIVLKKIPVLEMRDR